MAETREEFAETLRQNIREWRDTPDRFRIDRPDARKHLAFGFGIHRCLGNRLAEMQLKIVWEEILKRFREVEVVGEPRYLYSNFIRGITELPVRVRE